jgi:hypothetical protein
MKTRFFLIALILSPLLASYAQQEVKPISIVGTWRFTTQHPSGAVISATVGFTQNMKFTSSTTANEKPLMDSSGTWKIEGNKLEWKYEYSSHPAIAPGFTDTDEVLSVTETKLKLKSTMSGKVQDWERIH